MSTTAWSTEKANEETSMRQMAGAILFEAVARRGGTKSLRGVFNSWNDVEEAYRFWAEKARYRACQWRSGTDCVEPKA